VEVAPVSILGGKRLRELLRSRDPKTRLVVTPLLDVDAQLDQASGALDLRLGSNFILLERAGMAHLDPKQRDFGEALASSAKRLHVPFGGALVLHPKQFVLGSTLEYFRVPYNLAGYVLSRSSWGRFGLVVATAAAVHPGYFGVLCLELSNIGEVPVSLYAGVSIAQIFFHEVAGDPELLPAPSTYLGSTEPELPRIDVRAELLKLEPTA